MKRRNQRMAVLAIAGSATMASATPALAQYSGACNAYDPAPVTRAAQRIQYVPASSFQEVEAPALSRTTRERNLRELETVLARANARLEPVAEYRPAEVQVATIDRSQPILSRSDCVGGVRIIRTTSRPRAVRFERTLVRTNSDLAPVAERLEPVAERIEPVRERVVYRKLEPVGERVVFRRDLEPVAERMIARPANGNGPLIVEEEIITTTRYHKAKKKAKRSKSAKAHHSKARKLEPVAEKKGRCTYRKVERTKLEPVRERTFIKTNVMPESDRSLPDFSNSDINFGNPYR